MAKNQYTTSFGDGIGLVMAGDTISAYVDGFDVTASLQHDPESSPRDWMDPNDPEDARAIKAWERDEWFFVGVVLSVERNGVVLADNAASLWGIEANYPRGDKGDDNSYLTEVANELLSEALEVAHANLCRVCAA